MPSGTQQDDVASGTTAEIEVVYPYNSIGITYFDAMIGRKPYQIRHTVAHELAHVWTAPMRHTFNKLEDLPGVSQTEYNILESAFSEAEERAVEMIADQITRLLPEFVE